MRVLSEENIAVARDYLVGIVPAVIGVIIVIGLVMAVVYGRRRRAQEPPAPQQPQPRAGAWHIRQELGEDTPADHGPGHQNAHPVEYEYEPEDQEPEEIERTSQRERLRPQQIRPHQGPHS
ncbi:DUF6479 family protein [Streptomyces sp. SL13]|jgi:hypothetical protein|uniref:DUF6479 family protein n=1 Tax=Streptantibioticus silvisoli TaxID=2705255 RepID=A0AA90H1L2_9ACTN|nr:DUF6479 family protein [Streptantibioticus silvisoli]MDI5962566.1 DUF6479 family protein [Streptantibioticus silvisoli]MDI5969199.1 DUF6479 family protein [Streptantibioticus silvisoli]